MLMSFALIFLCGMLLGRIAAKLRLPSLVGMILAGMVIGPHLLNLIDPLTLDISGALRKFALAVILTRAGLALNLGELKQVGRPAILMCFLPACLEILGCMLIAPWLLGLTIWEAALLGSVIAAVSPAVVVPRMINLMNKGYGTRQSIPQMIMAASSVDDVFVIILFTAFTTLVASGEFSAWTFAAIPFSIASGIAVGIAVGLLLSTLYKQLQLTSTYKTLIHLSIAFILIAAEDILTPALPFSGLLAVMTMSVVLARREPRQAHELSNSFLSLWQGAELLLFVLVGMTIDLQYVQLVGSMALVVVFGALLFRMSGVALSLVRTRLVGKERLFCMIAYSPKATVQAAIGSIPLAMGLACGHTILTVAVLAILITAPLGAYGMDMTYRKLLKKSPTNETDHT